MAYSDNAYTADAINNLTGLLSGAIQAQAMRPMKSSTITSSVSENKPFALNDLINTRMQIGNARKNLDDALKARESFGYSLLDALSDIQADPTPGSWLASGIRGFARGGNAAKNFAIDRAQRAYENEMKDLANILAFDKAMGDTTTQTQRQDIGYEPMEYGTAKAGQSKGTGSDSLSGIQTTNFGRSVGYDPVENLPDFGPVTRAALSEEELGTMKYVPFAQSIAKGLTDKTATQLQSTWSDISDNILSGKVLDFVGKAGGIRVADTPAEQEFIFGPIRNYKNMTPSQLKQGLTQSRNNFVAAGLNKARQLGVDISEDELINWWNSSFSVPKGLESEKMYNIQNKPAQSTVQTNKANPIVGEVRNGVRFLGYNEDGSMKFEKAQ